MPYQPPSNRKSYKAILKRLSAAGWIRAIAEVDETAEHDPLLGIQFTPEALAKIRVFYDIHEGLWDLSDAERKSFHDLLWHTCWDSRLRKRRPRRRPEV